MASVNVNIKPIPKYIEKKIRALDMEKCPNQKGLRFYSYLTKMQGDVVKITVAMRNKNKKTALIKQVAIHGVNSKLCAVRDIEYCYLGVYAYRVGWYDEGIKYPHGMRPWYNDHLWYAVDTKYYNPHATVINPEFVLKQKEYKYSAIDIYGPSCPITYLKLYKQFPQLELLVKHGFRTLAVSKMILRKVGKDKKFVKWLIRNKAKLGGVNRYYVDAVIRAYNKGTDVDYEQYKSEFDRQYRNGYYKRYTDKFGKENLEFFIKYLAKQNTNVHSYMDYINACETLNLDMTLERNLFPKDFQRWHDIRIDEYKTEKAKQDAKKRQEMYENFAKVAEKYISLERHKKGNFIVMIAKSPEDLVHEGKILQHCVGSMNYDQKFIREETLIFFVRHTENVNEPFVTMEYSIGKQKILQCYGIKDTKPAPEVLDFVNKKWLPYANKQLNQLVA